MSAGPRKLRRSFGLRAAILLVVGGALYPLSLAPALKLANRGVIPANWVFATFGPVNEAYAVSPPPLQSVYDWYLALWGLPEDSQAIAVDGPGGTQSPRQSTRGAPDFRCWCAL